MHPADFAFLARLVQRRAGLVLTENRRGPVERRLEPVMRRFGFKDLPQLLAELQHGREALAAAVTEAMTINESSFFRDPALFQRLSRDILPELMARRAGEKRLRIWSAACAAGQEAYSLAMMLDNLGLAAEGWAVDLIASDISAEAIARAERGHYSIFEVQRGLSDGDLAVWFRPVEGGYTISEHIRRMVSFRRFNLLDSFGWLDDLDLVLCRNVLIHFDPAARHSVLERIAETMASGGVLVLGQTESAASLNTLFAQLHGAAGVYTRARLPSALLSAIR